MSKSDKKPDAPKSGLPSQRLNRKAVPCIAGVTPEETALNFANLMISPEMASFRVITNRERSELMVRVCPRSGASACAPLPPDRPVGITG